MGKRTRKSKGKNSRHSGAGRPGDPLKDRRIPGKAIEIPDPYIPAGYELVEAEASDAELFAPVLQLADPDNPDGTWSGIGALIAQADQGIAAGTRLVFGAMHESGTLAAALVAQPPMHWIGTHHELQHEDARVEFARCIATIDSVAVVETHRGKGLAQALITTAEQLLGDAEYPLVHIVHRPELTDFYVRLGYTHDPSGLRIGTPVGAVAQPNPTGYTGSWKALRDQVRVENLHYVNGTFDTLLGVIPGADQLKD
ncbi:GNAT family N-acetyltransferase [Streptomyces sp. NBC_00876]|uniref:GNAT family N-acetyltransferase n=1 Tax=Streptomyces sp. NBC_00876 TaxID=2975853 RepID=UPI00386D5DAA|nr:GNAT family N-acetyltransferase [Streptomyces sp. NBC_00876]